MTGVSWLNETINVLRNCLKKPYLNFLRGLNLTSGIRRSEFRSFNIFIEETVKTKLSEDSWNIIQPDIEVLMICQRSQGIEGKFFRGISNLGNRTSSRSGVSDKTIIVSLASPSFSKRRILKGSHDRSEVISNKNKNENKNSTWCYITKVG